ncbi:efflux ABC transporter permease/ATP-binding protein [Nitzschia inconspicua]|uniref:Efflux ABC transporter permease/ATP-binding protein n=1 Tax=Nitzschia inconspicua TaxID=303405 RepID=A0A9K3LLY9_9STRA|nr:efflux ABC transporter permease/ATP-binding protein [Nitzschia inconspicua]
MLAEEILTENNPAFQSLAFCLSGTNVCFMISIGIFFLVFPRIPINHSVSGDAPLLQPHLLLLESILRLSGGLLISQGLACVFLLYPIYSANLHLHADDCRTYGLQIWNLRTSIALQGMTGLISILVALISDRHGGPSNEITGLLIFGLTILVLSFSSGMLSFWPAVKRGLEASSGDAEVAVFSSMSTERVPVENELGFEQYNSDSLTEPLLTRIQDTEESKEEENCQHSIDEESQRREWEQPSTEEFGSSDAGYSDATTFTSRIRGTRRLLSLAAPQVIYLYIGCMTLLIRLPFSLAIPHFVSTTLGALSRGEFNQARQEVLRLFILGTVDACLDFWCIFWFGYANQRIVREVRTDTFASLLKQEVGFFDTHSSGELASRLNSDCGEMAGDLTWFFRFSIESVVRITGITTYMLLRSPKLGACALSILPLVAIINKFYGDWLSKNATLVQDALAAANSVAQETLSCVRTVISFASENSEYIKYSNRIDEQYMLNIRQIFITGIYYMFISTFLINTVVQGTLLLVGSYMIQHGSLASEVLLAFMLYQGQLQNEMMNLFNSFTSLIKSSGAGDKVFELLDRSPPAPATGSDDVLQARIQRTGDCPVSIQLENVHFAYPSRPNCPILKGINLNIEAGSTVALVGPSGCGKTSIVNLLQRYYDATAGVLAFDGTNIKEFGLKFLRQRIGIVTQEPVLFSGTVLSNISYGMPNATKEQAVEAAKKANAHDFIIAMPDGYETEVGERGLKLSGGQRQRVAISRAIIRHPSLLLLDEATSALDAESEEIVQRSIDSLLKDSAGITTIVIAHRLQTVRNADVIACINDGKIVEMGSHDELLRLDGGYYQNMVSKSLEGKLVTD